jgi:all-trans-retinol 13,14-reductase
VSTRKSAIVIGAGMGGLTSAVLLASHGYDVTVHEQHFRPGGLLHRFFREGSAYDTGFHYCGGVEHQDILGRCLRHLGVFDGIEFQDLDPDGFDRLVYPGFEFRVPVGLDNYRQRLKETFPHEADGIDLFIGDMLSAIQEYGLYVYRTDVNVVEFLRWEGLSLEQAIDRRLKDPAIKAVLTGQCVLYGVPAHDAPFGLHSVIMHHFLRGAHRVVGGGDRLAKVMVQRIKQLGGSVHLRSEVTQLLVEDRVAVGVRLASGEEQRADLVISNLNPRVMLDLLPPNAVRKAYRSRVLGQKPGLAHLGAYLQLDGPVPEIGNSNIYRHAALEPARSFDPITSEHCPFYFATAPGEGYGLSRRGHNVVLMLTSLPWDQVQPWVGTTTGQRPEAYQVFKQALLERQVEALCADFPAIRERIVRIEGSTGLTTSHYTRSPRGAMYGHYHSVDQMGKYRPSQVLRIRNFVQVGQGVFTPGVLGATLSAYYGCGFHLGLDRLLDELNATPD